MSPEMHSRQHRQHKLQDGQVLGRGHLAEVLDSLVEWNEGHIENSGDFTKRVGGGIEGTTIKLVI